jgi:hypothetical protein
MLSRSQDLFSVAQPLLAVPQKPLDQHAATLHPDAILGDSYPGIVQVLDSSESKSEPEQSIENTSLTEAKKANLSILLKTKDRVWGGFFVENEPEHFVENKQHY